MKRPLVVKVHPRKEIVKFFWPGLFWLSHLPYAQALVSPFQPPSWPSTIVVHNTGRPTPITTSSQSIVTWSPTRRSRSCQDRSRWERCPTFLGIMAPPGSGYLSEKDEVSELPSTYEPMMEYPGTMRPGMTPENIPFQDLPIGDDDPDNPVPWPHFQEIEWHHRWDPPHEHPMPMEQFIEQLGRWATPELEAEMRAGVRRGIREQRQAEETGRRGTVITDDEEYDDIDDDMSLDADVPVALGDGIFGQLGSTADQAATAAAVDPNNQSNKKKKDVLTDDDEDDVADFDDDDDDDGSLDDFLFDLGLDSEVGDDDDSIDRTRSSSASLPSKRHDDAPSTMAGLKTVAKSLRDLDVTISQGDDDDDDDGVVDSSAVSASQTIHVEEEEDVDLDFDDVDDEDDGDAASGGGPVPLDDFGGGSDEDNLGEDIFDEGGFDFDDDFDDGGGDMW